MRTRTTFRTVLLEHLKSRFLWYAAGIGILLSLACTSFDFSIGYTPPEGGARQDLGHYVRPILFQVQSLYWILIGALLGSGVLLQEIDDGSIDLVLTSTADRNGYVLQRVGGTLVACSTLVSVCAGVGLVLGRLTGVDVDVRFVVANLGLLLCFAWLVVVCALLSSSGLGRNVGAASFLLYLLFWFIGSGYFDKFLGPHLGRALTYAVPNVWQWQMEMGKFSVARGPSWKWVWPLLNLSCYTMAGLLICMRRFRTRDL